MYSNFQKMCREYEPFTQTFSKLGAIQKQIVLFVTDFRQRLDCLKSKAEGIQSVGWDSVTVNSAGRLLSFSISLGIPILSQRTRKFSLHEFK